MQTCIVLTKVNFKLVKERNPSVCARVNAKRAGETGETHNSHNSACDGPITASLGAVTRIPSQISPEN